MIGTAAKFTVEQPARLNRLVDDTIPLTWQVRWRSLRICLPLLVFSSVCFAEMIFIRAWLADQMVGVWPKLILCFLFPPVLLLAMSEVLIRVHHAQKRRLTLKKRGLAFQPGDLVCTWKSFAGLRFESLCGQLLLKRCFILSWDRRRQLIERRRWSLALDTTQQQALVNALPAYRPFGSGEVRIEEATAVEPIQSPVQPRRFPYLATTISLLGLWLFLHGAPLAFLCYGDEKPRSRGPESGITISDRRGEQIAGFVKRQFGSFEEFRSWGFWTGVSLTALGISGFFLGGVMMTRSSSHRAANNRFTQPSDQTPVRVGSISPR